MTNLDSILKSRDSARFGSTYTKIGMIQRRLAWPLRKDDRQIREAFHIFKKIKNKKKIKKKRISVYVIVSSANRDNFTLSFPI